MSVEGASPSLRRWAWTTLAVNIFTVVGGALVRATGSGAGCGDSWPSCRGTVVPGMDSVHTQIEFAHRALSGLSLIFVLVLVVRVYRSFPKGSSPRLGARLSAIAILVESLLGAWLVLARLVEDNASVMRGISVPVHLVNTLFLLAALTCTAWSLDRGQKLRLPTKERGLWVGCFISMLLIGATGAVAALSDTLFPVESLKEGLAADFTRGAHWLTRIRILHPVIAVVGSYFALRVAIAGMQTNSKVAKAALFFLVTQICLGVTNVLLLTPLATQLIHLLVADLLWVSLVYLALERARVAL